MLAFLFLAQASTTVKAVAIVMVGGLILRGCLGAIDNYFSDHGDGLQGVGARVPTPCCWAWATLLLGVGSRMLLVAIAATVRRIGTAPHRHCGSGQILERAMSEDSAAIATSTEGG
jgi:hypothetical protein